MSWVTVSHPTGDVAGTFLLPSSKSITNRLLILQALYPDRIDIVNGSEADDSVIMQRALKQRTGVVNVENAGTCLRFLMAYFAVIPGDYILHGTDRLHQRPVYDLVNALRQLGADMDYIDQEGFAPLRIRGKELSASEVEINGEISSQHITALMLIGAYLPNGLTIRIKGKQVSTGYIWMTERILFELGIVCKITEDEIDIPPQKPRKSNFYVEADWSAASYWYSFAALSKTCDIQLPGLTNSYLQGDIVIANYMDRFGVHTSFENGIARLTKTNVLMQQASYNMVNEPDLVPALCVCLAGLGVEVLMENIRHLRDKESDRISALETELLKCGVKVKTTESSIEILPSNLLVNQTPEIETYNDHRMAMAFAALALRFKTIRIKNPEVVAKSYPSFWEELKKAGFELHFG